MEQKNNLKLKKRQKILIFQLTPCVESIFPVYLMKKPRHLVMKGLLENSADFLFQDHRAGRFVAKTIQHNALAESRTSRFARIHIS